MAANGQTTFQDHLRTPHDGHLGFLMAQTSPATEHVLQPHRRILELDSLRALAAINLLLFHFTHVYSVKFGYTSPLGFEWPYGA